MRSKQKSSSSPSNVFRSALASIFILVVVVTTTVAQDPGISARARSGLNGDIAVVEYERVYIIRNGKNVGAGVEKLLTEKYDDRNRIAEQTVFGKGHKKTTYTYVGDSRSAETMYFDAGGNRVEVFDASVDVVNETGLCPSYSFRREKDHVAKIERSYEICTDGSTRSTTVDELDHRGEVVRSTRVDAKSRSWTWVFEYDIQGNLHGYTYTVSPVIEKPYTITVVFSDHRFDTKHNWTRMTATGFHSKYPGQLLWQYNEVRNITYRDASDLERAQKQIPSVSPSAPSPPPRSADRGQKP